MLFSYFSTLSNDITDSTNTPKRNERRYQVCHEVLDTEENYVRVLRILLEVSNNFMHKNSIHFLTEFQEATRGKNSEWRRARIAEPKRHEHTLQQDRQTLRCSFVHSAKFAQKHQWLAEFKLDWQNLGWQLPRSPKMLSLIHQRIWWNFENTGQFELKSACFPPIHKGLGQFKFKLK